jgi:alkylglycerol monooxygenase
MDLIAVAVPFFLLALLLELVVDRIKGRNYFRANDAINSLSAGTLMTTGRYFTGFIGLFFWGYTLEKFSIVDMPLTWFDASPSGIILWAVAALAWDFSYYWFHRCSHEISVFWAAHAVHHQSEDYNLSTALRQTSTDFRVHHAQNERYIDKNYGGMLILWDRMFGTFQDELDNEPVVFGVRKPLANWNPFWANLQVYDYLWFDAVHTKRWRDKLGIWFRPTGWRPEDVAQRYPKSRVDLATFDKFDPSVALRVRRYVLGQFMAALVVVLLIADLYAKAGAIAVVWPCFVLWALLYTIGLLNEGRVYAARLEAVRLILVVPVAAGLFVSASVITVENTLLLTAVGGYVVVSLSGLLFVSKSQVVS